MDRRNFILLASCAALSSCNVFGHRSEDPYLRFAIASDGHYGEPGADYDNDFRLIVTSINEYHERSPLNFLMINGDISHDQPEYLFDAKVHLDGLNMPLKVSKGNHDRIDEGSWLKLWGVPFDYNFSIGNEAFITLNTSDLEGAYLCPDYSKLRTMLNETKNMSNVFLFMHINPAGQTKFAVECQKLVDLLKSNTNVRAVFNGHDHDHDNILIHQSIPFVFDGRFGGTWGTEEKGFRVVECYEDGKIITFMVTPSMVKDQVDLS